jgi:hypothetical protein
MSIFDTIRNKVADEVAKQLHEKAVTGLNVSNNLIDGAVDVLDTVTGVVIAGAGVVDDYVDYFEDVVSDIAYFLNSLKTEATEAVQKEETKLYGNEPKDGCPAKDKGQVKFDVDGVARDFNSKPLFEPDKAPYIHSSLTPSDMLSSAEARSELAAYYNVGLHIIEQLTKGFSDARLRAAVSNVRGF